MTDTFFSKKISEQLLLLSFPLLYFFLIYNYFWVYPLPSDPLLYTGGIDWGTTYGFFPWLDRIMVANGIRAISFIPGVSYLAGPIYIGTCNMTMVCLSMYLAYKHKGFWAACCVGVFWNTSLLLLGWATYVYADQTLALYSLLAYTAMHGGLVQSCKKAAFWGGFFAALAAMSKITGIATAMALTISILFERDKSALFSYIRGLLIGVFFATVLYGILYDFSSLIETIKQFFINNLSKNLSLSRPNLVNYTNDVLLSIKYLPFLGLIAAASAYREKTNQQILLIIWAHITVLLLLYSLTHRGGWAIPHYLYTPYVFCILFVSLVAGTVLQTEAQSITLSILKKYLTKITVVAVLIGGILWGLQIGDTFPPVLGKSTRYIYQEVPTIFQGKLKEIFLYPIGVRWLYSFGPLLILLLFTASLNKMTRKHNRLILFCFLAFLGCWGGAFTGGMALHKVNQEKKEATEMYAYAAALDNIPLDRYFLYVEAAKNARERKRLIWVYHLFFDTRRGQEKSHISRYNAAKELVNKIVWVKNRKQLKEYANSKTLKKDDIINFYSYLFMVRPGFIKDMARDTYTSIEKPEYIVTDVPDIIKKEWNSAKITDELCFMYNKDEKKLYIIEI